MTLVCILDYGSGNVSSVNNMVSQLTDSKISNLANDLDNCTHIVLPGVGGFAAAMTKIKETLPLESLISNLEKGKPFLGICVGMQVLFQRGDEFGSVDGLGLLEGRVSKLSSNGLNLPHVGWNSIESVKPHALLSGLSKEDDFYFTHSYAPEGLNEDTVIARTEYGESFTSIVGRDNLLGVQFHPEKSQSSGFKLMENFLELS